MQNVDFSSVTTNICFDCKKAVGGCSWSEKFEPVEGWKAEPSIIAGYIESYYITECPLFERDEPRDPKKPVALTAEQRAFVVRFMNRKALLYGGSAELDLEDDD